MVATAAEESVNPLRDVPVATVGSVVICGAMYVLMAVAIVGMVPYTQVGVWERGWCVGVFVGV
jgi:APA family basic amino acid/polyamine antiporter